MRVGVDRRDFLNASLALGGALALGGVAATRRAAARPAGGFVRLSAFDPRARLDSYRRGVERMKEWSDKDPKDPRGWTFQAAIHGSKSAGPFFGKCQHASWWFFPWHRAYVYFFERIVREASGDPDFTLPYWDWNIAGGRSLPEAFRDPKSKLYDDTRVEEVNAGKPLLARELDPGTALAARGFLGTVNRPGFGGVAPPGEVKGLLERPPHDKVHTLISGNMGDPDTAALDPIFWLHHANVDRLWDVWLASGRVNPTEDAWKKNLVDGKPKPFTFFDEKGKQVDVVTAEFIPGGGRLDYQYDNLQGNLRILLTDPKLRRRLEEEARRPPVRGAPPLTARQKEVVQEKRKAVFGSAPRAVVAAVERRVVLGADPVTVEAVIPPGKRRTFRLAVDLSREDVASPPVVVLHVEDVRSGAPPGVVFRVFLNQPTATAATDPDEGNYAGGIGLFRSSGHGAHEAPAGETFSFDITRLVQRLRARRKWDEAKVSITFVAKGVGGRTKPRGEVSFRRVSITIERE
jgi:tyrosinase